MDLVTPQIGLVFWTGLVFLLLLFILTKFAWKPILSAVKKREENIQNALDMAKETKAEMEKLQAQNENLLKEARAERDDMIKGAKATTDRMIDSAKSKAKDEADKLIKNAQVAIVSEKEAAVAELKNQVAGIALEIAEKIIREDLSTSKKQKDLAESLSKDINLN